MRGLGGDAFGFEAFEVGVGEDRRLHGGVAGFSGGIFHGAGEGGDDAVHAVQTLAEERETTVGPIAAFVGELDAQAERARGEEEIDGGRVSADEISPAVQAGVVRFTGRGTLPARAEAGGDRAGAVGHSGRVATGAEPEQLAIVAEIDGENPSSGGSDLHAEAGVGFVGVRQHSPSVGPAAELDAVRADGVRLGDAADGYEFAGNGVETADERGGAAARRAERPVGRSDDGGG